MRKRFEIAQSVTRKNIYSSANEADGKPEWISPVKTGRDIDLTRRVRETTCLHRRYTLPVHESPGKRGRVSLNTVD